MGMCTHTHTQEDVCPYPFISFLSLCLSAPTSSLSLLPTTGNPGVFFGFGRKALVGLDEVLFSLAFYTSSPWLHKQPLAGKGQGAFFGIASGISGCLHHQFGVAKAKLLQPSPSSPTLPPPCGPRAPQALCSSSLPCHIHCNQARGRVSLALFPLFSFPPLGMVFSWELVTDKLPYCRLHPLVPPQLSDFLLLPTWALL